MFKFKRNVRSYLCMCAVALIAGLGSVETATAQPVIPEGFDLWVTVDASIDIGSSIDLPDLPAGFFGPGSDVFSGTINLEGVPLDPFENTDTVIERLNPADLTGPPVASDTVPIELVELSLRSIDPIVVEFGGSNPQFFDVFVTLSPDPQPTGGLMTINKDFGPSPNSGGTFNSILPIQPVLTFVEVGNPGNTQQLVIGGDGQLDLQQINNPPFPVWTEQPPIVGFGFTIPSILGNQFFPAPVVPYTLSGDGFTVSLVPATGFPEPASAVILVAAFAGISARRRPAV